MPNLGNITVTLDTVSKFIPEVAMVMTAYDILKNIWMKTNPGKTEDDYRTYLQTTATANIDDTATYLNAQGYVQAADGSWRKPAV